MRHLLLLPLLAACVDTASPPQSVPSPGTTDSDDGGGDTTDTDTEPAPAEGLAPAARADLRLKRWRQLQLDLEGALRLSSDELCRETGLYDCTDLHVVPLGGVSVPNGLYRPVDTISATTGLAMERLVLQACFNRLQKDQLLQADGEAAEVFGAVDLSAGATSAGAEARAAQATILYQRLLARDPLSAELAALEGLADTLSAEGGADADWALMACFAVGTSTEALVY